jgi:hypothetical protein
MKGLTVTSSVMQFSNSLPMHEKKLKNKKQLVAAVLM